jgi:general secretion pathway protein A
LAYQSLFKQWGVFYPQEPFMLACQFAELNDLKCLHKQGNWRSMLRLDRPAVLSLLNENGEALVVTLLRIEGDRARIALNGELMWVTMDEVDRHWLGEYSVLYRVPPYRSHSITPGQPNEDQWLQAQLQKVSDSGLLQGFSIGLGRRPLSSIIEDFQRAVGLVPDGIAGSMTIIHLNTVLDAGSPSLLGKG